LPATVQLSFERNSRSYVIRKAFLRSPSATLTEDGREIARGKHADEAIWELLGISRGSGRTIDEGAFGVLWVGQGASFAPPTPAAGASSMLNAAIEAEVGTLVGGQCERLVIEEVSGELKRHVTDTERPRSDGPFHSALRDVERWRAAEAFDRLSNGTREQIAVLVRLAMGARLAERGEAAPIILDDALVYCDDDRIERMFDALSRAGKNQQIIVLTCRLRSFGPLGGHTLRVNDTGRTDTVLRSFACRR
jgi:hypothetical protein